MRDYGKVAPSFWTGETGKSLRGDQTAQVVALYLMTSPHATMYGVYYCPVLYIAHDTGCSIEGASKALRRLIEGGYCTFDPTTDTVFVHEMARFQVGESLKAGDKRISNAIEAMSKMPKGVIREGFRARYKQAFRLPDPTDSDMPHRRGIEGAYHAPPKPGAGEGERTGAGEDSPHPPSFEPPAPTDPKPATPPLLPPPPAKPDPRGHRIPDDWSPSEDDIAYATERGFSLIEAMELSDEFRDYWRSKAGKDARKTDWSLTWKTRVRDRQQHRAEKAQRQQRPTNGGGRGGDYEAHQLALRMLTGKAH